MPFLLQSATFVPILYSISCASLLLRIPLGPFHAWIAILLGALGVARLYGYKAAMQNMAIFISLAALGLWLNRFLIDIFYDSRSYHFSSIFALREGWNPWADIGPCTSSATESLCTQMTKYAQHYPKSYWIVSATFMKAIGSLASTHLVNFFMLSTSVFVSASFAEHVLDLNKRISMVFSFLWSLSATVIWQLFSNYIDGALAAGLSAIFLGALLYIETGRRFWLMWTLIFLPFVINLKFTGMVYAVALGGGVLAYAFGFKKYRVAIHLAIGALLSIALGLGILGWNPYVTNSLTHHNPFYPAVGQENGEDILSKQASEDFLRQNRLETFLISTFSVAKRSSLNPKLEPPWSRLSYFPKVNTRYSGHGPLFSGCLLLGAAMLFWVAPPAAALWLVVFLSLFTTSAAWYARLAPQAAWLPLLACALALSPRFSRKKSILFRNCLAGLLIGATALNAITVAKSVYEHQSEMSAKTEDALLRGNPRSYVSEMSAFSLHSTQLAQQWLPHLRATDGCVRELDLDPKIAQMYRGIRFCAE